MVASRARAGWASFRRSARKRRFSVKASSLVLVALVSLGAVVSAQEEDAIRPDEIGADHVGKKVAVEGRVYSNSKSPAGIHLYFGADTSTAFQALVSSKSIYKFQVDVVKKFDRRNVRVTGTVEEESGKYFIRVDEPSQLNVVARKRETSG
jgi:hypothetical protein